MQSKPIEKEEAIRLRSNGYSLSEIVSKLRVSKSSASHWVRGVKLSETQKKRLNEKAIEGQKICCSKNMYGNTYAREHGLKRRRSFQDRGRERARSEGIQYASGCMLYWAEGSKKRNSMVFCNSDINMMFFFMSFLRKYFNFKESDLRVDINCYTGNGLSIQEIMSKWLSVLGTTEKNIRSMNVDKHPKSTVTIKKGKLPYGVCAVILNRTDIVQEIYGAIQEFGYFVNDTWLD